MPIVADPEQLALISDALDAYRKSKNVDLGSELYERAAQRVICLFESGMRDPQAMRWKNAWLLDFTGRLGGWTKSAWNGPHGKQKP